MTKHNKRQKEETDEQKQEVVKPEAQDEIVAEQAVEISENFAKDRENEEASSATISENKDAHVENVQTSSNSKKSGGSTLALLALLVALGIGGAGHYLTNNKFAGVEQQIAALKTELTQPQPLQTTVELPNFDAEKVKIGQLEADYRQSLERISQLELAQGHYLQQIKQLQGEIQKLGSSPQVDQTAWLLSDADFLLNNALRKMVLDNDIDTAKSLLMEADNVLSAVSSPQALSIREAIKSDLNQLTSVNEVDQNNLMQRLALLANLVDNMPMAEIATEQGQGNTQEVSDSIADWQSNIEKSANSFLSRFIRVTDKNVAVDKGFIAPNQEIYLRENIRLRLQIAILAVPRQQNELYKQSLEAVSSWTRSYFDVSNENVAHFLKELDDLMDQSIYVDAPTQLQSLKLLDQFLNKSPRKVEKIALEDDKSLELLKVEEAPAQAEEAKPVEPAPSTTEQPVQAQ